MGAVYLGSNNMKNELIQGVQWLNLKVIDDERGSVLHMVRTNTLGVSGFGEIYFSELKPNVVKGWKIHHSMTQRLTVPIGLVRFVLVDAREGSLTRGRSVNYIVGRPENYGLLIIPPGIWYAFENLSISSSLVANCADKIHDPIESTTRSLDSEVEGVGWIGLQTQTSLSCTNNDGPSLL